MAIPFPGRDVPVVDVRTGLMSQQWYDYFQNHQKLSQFPDVSVVAPLNGQVLIWNTALRQWVPGAN